MLKVKQFVFSYFEENTYLAIDEATHQAAVIDPSMMNDKEHKVFDNYVSENNIKITQVINTHMHLDHCFGLNYVKSKYGVVSKAHSDDRLLADIIDQQYMMFGMQPKGEKVSIDVELKDGDIIDIGESKLQVIHVPGHTQGGIALYCKESKLLFAGDTLFRGSVGRTDLPGGNQMQLINSIRKKLFKLPDDTVVLPGHNDMTTIGYEKNNNPFA